MMKKISMFIPWMVSDPVEPDRVQQVHRLPAGEQHQHGGDAADQQRHGGHHGVRLDQPVRAASIFSPVVGQSGG
jgi:hypothetical protein